VAAVVADTHVLLWMLKGTLAERSQVAADAIDRALTAETIHVSIVSFLDLRYLVDSGRLSQQVLDETRAIVDGDSFTVVPLDLPVIDRMASVSKDEVPDPFDRIIAATALATDLPLITADERIHDSLGNQAVW